MRISTRRLPLLLGALLLADGPLSAQGLPALAPDLKVATDRHAAFVEQVNARRDERIRAAKAAYAGALEQLQKQATARGDLDSALAAKTERESLAAAGLVPPAKGLPKALLADRHRFDQSVAQASAQAAKEEMALTQTHIAALEALQTRITKQGQLEAAGEVKEKRLAAIARLTALGSGKGAAPLPAFETAVPLPASTLPSASPSKGLDVPPVIVAAELKAKGGAKETAPNAVVFDGPKGDGRSGAKGILLKQEANAIRAGSTWAFRYVRAGSAYGLQIIHPVGRGQAIAFLGPKDVGLSTPDAWQHVGYGGGDDKRVHKTNAFEKIFPLQDGQEYTVVSRLSAGGAYELFVNGELVATGRASSAEPLSLEIPPGKTFSGAGRGDLQFKGVGGAELSLRWMAGWAGLLLGPLDGGTHVVRDVRFYPTVAAAGLRQR